MYQCPASLGGATECIGPIMSTATVLKGVSINGIDPSGTFLTLPLLTVHWHTLQERQNLMTSWCSPGQRKFWSILTSVFFAPGCPLNADSWFTFNSTRSLGPLSNRYMARSSKQVLINCSFTIRSTKSSKSLELLPESFNHLAK